MFLRVRSPPAAGSPLCGGAVPEKYSGLGEAARRQGETSRANEGTQTSESARAYPSPLANTPTETRTSAGR